MKKLFILIITLLTLVACNQPAPTPTPTAVTGDVATATPLPAATNTTGAAEATPTPAPTQTAAPLPPTFTAVPTEDNAEPAEVTPSPVVDPAIIPPASIIISRPGSGSLVSSPLTIRGVSNPSFENNIVARIVTADGAVIARANASFKT